MTDDWWEIGKEAEETPLRKAERLVSDQKVAWLRARRALGVKYGERRKEKKKKAKRAANDPLTREEAAKIQDLRARGFSYDQIKAATGRSLYCIHKYVKKGGAR
jgi:SOS response regulatory protein OraA/RecX